MHRPRRRTSGLIRPVPRLPPPRRVLAAVLAACTAGGTAYLALERPYADAVGAVVAVRALPVGHVLSHGDVQVRALPRPAVPVGAVAEVEAVLDRQVVSPLAQGEVLTTQDLRTSALLSGLAEGTVAVFLPLAEPAVAATVGAADVVDVHSPVDGSVVVAQALVLGSGTGDRPGLWLGVEPAGARAMAAARGADPVGAVLQVALHPGP